MLPFAKQVKAKGVDCLFEPRAPLFAYWTMNSACSVALAFWILSAAVISNVYGPGGNVCKLKTAITRSVRGRLPGDASLLSGF